MGEPNNSAYPASTSLQHARLHPYMLAGMIQGQGTIGCQLSNTSTRVATQAQDDSPGTRPIHSTVQLAAAFGANKNSSVTESYGVYSPHMNARARIRPMKHDCGRKKRRKGIAKHDRSRSGVSELIMRVAFSAKGNIATAPGFLKSMHPTCSSSATSQPELSSPLHHHLSASSASYSHSPLALRHRPPSTPFSSSFPPARPSYPLSP